MFHQSKEQNKKMNRFYDSSRYTEQKEAIISLSSRDSPLTHYRVYKYFRFSCIRFNRLHHILLVSCFSLCAFIYVYGRLSSFYPQQYYSIFSHRSLNISNASFMCKVTISLVNPAKKNSRKRLFLNSLFALLIFDER